jgi:hypothetical protein
VIAGRWAIISWKSSKKLCGGMIEYDRSGCGRFCGILRRRVDEMERI